MAGTMVVRSLINQVGDPRDLKQDDNNISNRRILQRNRSMFERKEWKMFRSNDFIRILRGAWGGVGKEEEEVGKRYREI